MGAVTRNAYRLEALRDAATGATSIPAKLPADTPLFTVPVALVKILNRDLRLAGIPKRDERGRTVDVHALRHTFGTLLSKGGVAPRTAQAAMRHSTINLTMNTYTDPKLLDVAGAVESLPSLPLTGGTQGEGIAAKATGTDDLTTSPLVPVLVPTHDKSRTVWSTRDKKARKPGEAGRGASLAVSGSPVKRSEPLSTLDNGSRQWAMADSNGRPPRCKRGKQYPKSFTINSFRHAL